MVTHFITLEMPLQTNPAEMQRSILKALQQRGKPLRWAVVGVDADRQLAQVEAVVTTTADFLLPSTSIQSL